MKSIASVSFKTLVLFIIITVIMTMGILSESVRADEAYGEAMTVHSMAMNRDFPVLVFTPADYAISGKSYPVVYMLHGVNNEPVTEEGVRNLYGPGLKILEKADYYQVIIVTPIIGTNWYLDSPLKPENRYATYIGEELPAFMDKNYRTKADREWRILSGFSMGGYGAVSLLCRYPDTFSVALSRAGALSLAAGVETLDWDDVGNGLNDLVGDYWQDRKNYHQNSCLNLINHIRERDDVALVIEVGQEDYLYKINSMFRDKLVEYDMPHIYAEYPGGHQWGSDPLGSLLAHLQYFRDTIE